jgi:hypothetical protein
VNSQPSPPPEPPVRSPQQAPQARADAEAARIFDEEIRTAVRYEKGLAVKAVIALALVALVVAVRMLFLG